MFLTLKHTTTLKKCVSSELFPFHFKSISCQKSLALFKKHIVLCKRWVLSCKKRLFQKHIVSCFHARNISFHVRNVLFHVRSVLFCVRNIIWSKKSVRIIWNSLKCLLYTGSVSTHVFVSRSWCNTYTYIDDCWLCIVFILIEGEWLSLCGVAGHFCIIY